MDLSRLPEPATGLRAAALDDSHGRRFEYLRLSLTEACNFRCAYCLPEGYRQRAPRESELSVAEIRRAVAAFSALGLWKVRLTGGEPSLRRDLAAIARAVAGVPGIRRLAMTTNGYRLARDAGAWRAAGVEALNVSIDTLDPARFKSLTGHDRLASILEGLDVARDAGFASVKINAVLMRGINDRELGEVCAFVAERGMTWRYIETMRTNDNADFHSRHFLPASYVTERLEKRGWQRLPRKAGAGPSIDYAHPSGRGTIGVIAPYAAGFCASCNRLRLSAAGRLHLCLFGDGGIDLRPLLQSDEHMDELIATIRKAVGGKAASHRLHQNDSGARDHLASIGG